MKEIGWEQTIATKDGNFIAVYTLSGLRELCFPGTKVQADLKRVKQGMPEDLRSWHRQTELALKAVLAGKKVATLPPLDLSGATDFQRNVWKELRRLGPGETKPYGAVASAVGKPKASRAVGSACGANPLPLLIPCHRVLGAQQQLGGFTSGLPWKRKLLAREGITFTDKGRVKELPPK